MLFPAKMYEVTIITPKTNRERVIEELRGYVQLDEFEVEDTRKLYPDAQKIEETMAKLERLTEVLKPKGKSKKSRVPLMDAEAVAIEVTTKLENLNKRKKEIEKELRKLQKMTELIDTERFIGIVQIFTETSENWEAMRTELTDSKIIATRLMDDEIIILGKEMKKGLKGNYNKIRRRLISDIRKIKHELRRLDREKQKIGEKYGAKINTLKKQVEIELKILMEKRKLTHSELFTFMKGWVPEKHVNRVKSIEDTVVFLDEAGDDAPTKLDNPWFFKPFENFMYMFALPKYGEFDPTPLISIFFPLFYGVMLSDAGYGLLLLLVALATRRKFRVISELLLISSVATIFFGVMFDSYFGISLGRVVISPIERPFQLLYYALVFGVFYVDLGLVMGMIQNLLNDNYYEALTQQISLFIFQFGLAFFMLHLQGGIIMMLVGLGLKVWADNIRGFLELPSFLSSIISFSRLAALALATAWISFTINFLAGLLASIHGIAIIPATLLIILGHLFNFGFNAFGAFIHALRLHYVEFMGLFFTAKGKPFTPLGK